MCRRVGADAALDVGEGGKAREVHRLHDEEVEMRVVEAGGHEPPAQVDGDGVRTGEATDLGIGPHAHDAVAGDGESLGARARVASRPDAAVHEDAVGARS
jgi:hypothetical protein